MQKQALLQWNNLSDTDSSSACLRMMECLVHSSDSFISSDSFDQKFPSYARRAAIVLDLGIVSADQSAWKTNGCKEALKLEACKHRVHALYRGKTYKPVIDKETDEVLPYAAKIKVFRNNDWVWAIVRLSRTDVDYLKKRSR
jgi:putative transposase